MAAAEAEAADKDDSADPAAPSRNIPVRFDRSAVVDAGAAAVVAVDADAVRSELGGDADVEDSGANERGNGNAARVVLPFACCILRLLPGFLLRLASQGTSFA